MYYGAASKRKMMGSPMRVTDVKRPREMDRSEYVIDSWQQSGSGNYVQ